MFSKALYIIALSSLLVGCGHGINSGTGKKIGQVIQIGQHGMFCSTYEGKLVRGGFNTGSGVSGGVFDFTVDSDALFMSLNHAMEAQQEIEITYTKVTFSGPCTAESDHFVTAFRVISETTPTVTVKPPADEKEKKRQELIKQLKDLDAGHSLIEDVPSVGKGVEK